MISTKLKMKPVLNTGLDKDQLQNIRKQLQQWQKDRTKMNEKKTPLFKSSELLEELHVPSLSDIKAKNKTSESNESNA